MLVAALCAVALSTLAFVDGNVIVYTQVVREIADEFRDLPAAFGGDLPLEGLRGYLVSGEPADGCGPLAKPPTVDNFTDKWIVLLARYNCSFELKIRNAQAAGYDCAIVHNVNSSELQTMSANDSDGIVIPSVFVSDLAGLILSEQYLYNNGYYIMVNGELPFNINTHLLLPFAVVVALCLLVLIVFMIVKCIKDRRRARRHRLPSRALRKIPTCKFSKGDPYETCAICLDDYVEGERLRVLPCAHAYHAKCIDPWLTQNRRVCPVCKRRVFAAGERRRRDSQDSDDSREPLVEEEQSQTQGGTFEEQSENPFVRAARFMSRLRRREPDPSPEDGGPNETPPQSQHDPTDTENANIVTDDTRPLLADTADTPDTADTAVTQRDRRRNRRSTRTRSAGEPRTVRRSGGFLRSADHSINQQQGEIGVAALPAPPHHLNL